MKEFNKIDKVFIKSNNTVFKIYNRYLYCLIPFLILIIIYNLIWGSTTNIISLLLSTITSLITVTIAKMIINLVNKQKNNLKKILLEDNLLSIAIIISLFSYECTIPIIIFSSIITIIIKTLFKTKKLSASLYGILILLISKYYITNIDSPLINLSKLLYIDSYNNIVTPYGNIIKYILGLTPYYLSPILSVGSFMYLFHKKSIKYNIVFSYIITIIFSMLFFGLFNNMNIWFLIFQLTTGNILFLTTFILPVYQDTPTTSEGQIIYGLILGLITFILRFIIPELSVVVTLIIGPFILTKILNKISFKLKYNQKFYYTIITIIIILIIITNIILNIII